MSYACTAVRKEAQVRVQTGMVNHFVHVKNMSLSIWVDGTVRLQFYIYSLFVSSTHLSGLDSTSVTNILKNTTTLLKLRNMFRCFKHHLQP